MKKIFIPFFALLLSNASIAQTYYSENFESGNTWTYSDLDGDGNIFGLVNASSVSSSFGVKSLLSYSWYNSAYTPDNLATSPKINLPADASNIFLKFNLATDAGAGAEHYAVYLTTSNVPADIIAATPVKEETLSINGGLKEVAVDVSAFKGQKVYLTVRHYNCTDMYYLLMDNFTLSSLSSDNASLLSTKINKFITVNSQNDLQFTVKNSGSNTISSVEANWNDGTDHISTIPVNIPVGTTVTVTHPIKVSYSDIAQKNITVAVNKVNGNVDSDPSDNTSLTSVVVASQVIPKKVVIEEGTGTWCGWCPRGMVALKKLDQDYPDDQISIAVHGGSNSEPMRDASYSAGAGFSGFPGMNVDRELKGVDISPQTIGSYVVSRKTIPTPVLLGGEYTIDGSSLTAKANAQFFSNFSNANYRLAAIVVEDGVKGTGTGYKQSNYYAGGGNGVMGGFESLPSTVPAAQMTYDHVGRALLGGYNGQENSIPAVITDQQVVNYTFNYTIPAKYNYTTNAANDVIPNPDKMHVVLLLIDQNDNTIVNAVKLTKGSLAVHDISLSKTTLVYPNPAKTDFNIKVANDGKYNVVIYDMSGKVVTNYGTVSTSNKVANLPIKLLPGKYLVNISQNGESITKDLLVK